MNGAALPPGTRVLIVEDETIIAMTAEDMIEDLGCTVAATAGTLAQALDQVEAGGFDVAMLDINLNGELSLPVAERLRAAGTPFLFTTGYGSTGPGTAFTDAEVVRKPYRAADLAAALSRVLTPG